MITNVSGNNYVPPHLRLSGQANGTGKVKPECEQRPPLTTARDGS